MIKRKVILLNYNATIPGGISRAMSHIATMLHPYYDITVASLTGDGVFPFSLPRDVPFQILMPGKHRIRDTLLHGGAAIGRLLEQPDSILLILGDWCGIPAMWACKMRKAVCVICDHGTLSVPNLSLYTRIESFLEYHFCDKIVVLTGAAKNVLCHRFPKISGRIAVIPNSVKIPAEPVCHKYNGMKIITVSRLSEEKGLPELLDAAVRLRKKTTDFTWEIYGDGPLKNLTETEIMHRGLCRNVILMGYTQDIGLAYQQASVAVLTSKREGLCMMLLEAKTEGVPLVSFDVPYSPAELINDKKNGFLIPYADTTAMADAIFTLLTDKSLAKRFSLHSRDNLEPYEEKAVVKKWLSFLNSL